MISWLVWGAIFVAGLAYEAYTISTKRRGDTLTETTRTFFRVHKKLGRAIFAVAWLGFSVWFFGHILQWWP